MSTRPQTWVFRFWDARLALLAAPFAWLAFAAFGQRVDYPGLPPMYGLPLPWVRWCGYSSLECNVSLSALAVDLSLYLAVFYFPLTCAVHLFQKRFLINRQLVFFSVPIAAALFLAGTVGLAIVLPMGFGMYHVLDPVEPVGSERIGEPVRHMGWLRDLQTSDPYYVVPKDLALNRLHTSP